MLQLLLIVLATGLVFSPSAAVAKDLFRYETEAGTLSFTDNPDQIPARYRSAAKRVAMPPLAGYERLTVVPHGATDTPAASVEVKSVVARGSESRAPRSIQYSLGGETALEIPLVSDEPVVVRQLQWRRVERAGLSYWKAFTVIAQGGRILAEIEPD